MQNEDCMRNAKLRTTLRSEGCIPLVIDQPKLAKGGNRENTLISRLLSHSKSSSRVDCVSSDPICALAGAIRLFAQTQSVSGAFKVYIVSGSRAEFSTWPTRIAINNAPMLLRRRRKRIDISFDADFENAHEESFQLTHNPISPEQSLIREQSIKIVRRAICNLPRSLREYVQLRCLQELPPREVA
jgi:hypothetical protein